MEKYIFFHFCKVSDDDESRVNMFVRIDTCKRAWVLVCMYVRTCASGKADLYVQL